MSIGEYPAGPRGRRLVGNRYDYERDRIGFLQRCQRDYGDVFSFSARTSVVADPVLVHEILARTNTDFGIEVALFDDAEPEVNARATPTAMAGRKKSRPGVNRAAADAHSDRLVEILHARLAGELGRAVDVAAVMKSFIIRATTDYCLGDDSDEVAPAVTDAAEHSAVLMASSLSLPSWLPVSRVRSAKAANRRLTEVLHERIRQRHARPHDKVRDLLDTMLSDDGEALDEQTVYRTISVMLRASHGVPGTILAWAVLTLAREPEIAARIGLEVEGLVPEAGRSVTVDDLPFTEAVVKELLRAYIPTWLMGREVRTHTTLGRWAFQPGQQVMMPVYLIHRDPRWWDEPERFLPDRWLRTQQPHARFAYLPFGAGPRICLGNQVGLLQLVLAVATLVRDYDITVADADAVVMRPEALLVPAGLRATFARK
ncbi:cytochrome P450 [Dactylosporangium sucinum]|uniref:Cytochrome P450 n=1 Tax=Dactylosporangium sucinum TaxID=1424081 RepID=A0A917X630_9ACTN|nr:cytochrome P450 [Dactylosporangium sucinum]GGM74458.1 cytochrome P450 [Dactylosporangium sucinum]